MTKKILKTASFPLGILLFLSILAYKPESRIPPELQKQFFSEVLFAKHKQDSIHCGSNKPLKDCIDSASKYQFNSEIAVLIGNSQLHTINEYKDNDKTAPYFLHEMLLPKGIFLLTISYPNINLQEITELVKYLDRSLKVKKFIISATFDDTREQGIRSEISFLNKLKNTPSNPKIEADTVLVRLEDEITNFLGRFIPNWHRRTAARVIIISEIHDFRNRIFNITPSSKRKKLPAQYKRNVNSLIKLTENPTFREKRIIFLIPPIRDDFKRPYISHEYIEFKNKMKQLAEQSNNIFLDGEASVPNNSWGMRIDQNGKQVPDFMHFKSIAHFQFARFTAKNIN